MEAENLFSVLYSEKIDQAELEQVLSAHFGHAVAISPRQIEYRYTGDGATALTLAYDGDGELEAISPGTELRPDAISELKATIGRDLLTLTAPVVGSQVLFAHVPTTGWFRYKDVFQIVPVPDEAPRPPYVLGDHPLVLEVRVPGSPDAMIRMQRSARVAREIELLCVALMKPINGSLGIHSRHHWVIPNNADLNALRSQYCQELYTWPGAPGQTQDFSSVDGIAPVARVPLAEYYSRRGISVGQVLDLPDSLEGCLDAFFKLSRNERDRFLRASFWFRHAQNAYTYSQSASFVALASAIEALMPASVNTEPCVTCGKSTDPGPTKRFVDFVEQYAPEPAIPRSERRKFYALRSALSHGGSLLHSDRVMWSPGLTPDGVDQWQSMDSMWQIVRIALVNWLMARNAGGADASA